MSRIRPLLPLAAALSLALAVSTAVPARAGGREHYSLRLTMAKQGGRSLDLALPWDMVRGSSPFDFVDGSSDRREIARLKAAWDMLSRMPDDRTVVIHADERRTRAWKHAGSLVLEPLDDADHSRVRIPGEIVEAVLRHGGRLKTSDVDELLRRRGEIALVDVESDDARVSVRIDRGEIDSDD